MADEPRSPDDRKRQLDEDRRHSDRALWMLALMLVLAIGGWFLVQRLMWMSKVEDCVMSGHDHCAPVEDPNPR